MAQASAESPSVDSLRAVNRRFYDALWSRARLVEPQRLNTWPLIRSLLPSKPRRLEVAPGLRPRLPIEGTVFVDLSLPALAQLARRSARVVHSDVASLPFADRTFDLVCALDIVEHLEDDCGALLELRRVMAPGAVLLLSLPLHAARWTVFDEIVGHRRRYDPAALPALLLRHDFACRRSAVYGMKPRSTRLVEHGMWWLANHRALAMWWYNRIFMPLGVLFQTPLAFSPGLIETGDVDEIIMVCESASPV